MQVAGPSESGVRSFPATLPPLDPHPVTPLPPCASLPASPLASLGLARPPPPHPQDSITFCPPTAVTQSNHLASESAPIKETNGSFLWQRED